TAETKPSPSAVCQEASGSFSTGIIEAEVTNASRKSVPLQVAGNTFQSGARNGAVTRIATQTARPITGRLSSRAGYLRLAMTLAPIAVRRMTATMKACVHSIVRL